MIQENKFIFKFIYGVLVDELCESAQLITNHDLSSLAKSLENTHVKNINISPFYYWWLVSKQTTVK